MHDVAWEPTPDGEAARLRGFHGTHRRPWERNLQGAAATSVSLFSFACLRASPATAASMKGIGLYVLLLFRRVRGSWRRGHGGGSWRCVRRRDAPARCGRGRGRSSCSGVTSLLHRLRWTRCSGAARSSARRRSVTDEAWSRGGRGKVGGTHGIGGCQMRRPDIKF